MLPLAKEAGWIADYPAHMERDRLQSTPLGCNPTLTHEFFPTAIAPAGFGAAFLGFHLFGPFTPDNE
jgi:hypothetical protein